jgi:hypothetical protein
MKLTGSGKCTTRVDAMLSESEASRSIQFLKDEILRLQLRMTAQYSSVLRGRKRVGTHCQKAAKSS